jgi:hypothetical protein
MGGVPAFWVARDPLISLFRRRCRRWSCRLGSLGLLPGRALKNQVSDFAFLFMVLAGGDGGWKEDNAYRLLAGSSSWTCTVPLAEI